ncbi:MAG: hypothetical protein NC123_00645 [Butyrivibrio sp.]|nr:hypothetical protein [Acetatifactor muris]MCM1558043.1 hypothetical protein [Butyrivibrio sp.]
MKNKVRMLIAAVFAAILLTACGEDPELVQFRKNIDDFCTKISEIDSGMNNIDAEADNAVAEFLGYLDELDLIFQSFAKLDFPEEFDYLEATADEASQYMTTAVESYHEAYSNGSYNEYTAEYAYGNYSRAYKRIQIIISFLHGETPDDVNVIMEEES